jgi:DNA polymerase I-like protein with 3'-5' exonuclease and polymerase domains
MIRTVLVDRRNFDTELPLIIEAMQVSFIGLDCETEDSRRHEGLNQLMRVDDEGHKSNATRLIFDTRRTTMCGFSVHPEGCDRAWYVNLNHADVGNRLPWEAARQILDALPEGALWLSHNAPFEITMFHNCYGYELQNIICTMQLSVTAFGDDNYDIDAWKRSSLMGMEKWVYPLIANADLVEEDAEEGKRFNRKVEDIIGKITSKTSTADHSYNGYVSTLAYGHGLKQLVRQFFQVQMGTFKETLGENAHMGQLTGDEVAQYGAEDAYWVVPLFRKLLDHVAVNSPDALDAFFETENPMTQVYSELWRGGMRVNHAAILSRRTVERAEFARLLRSLRATLRQIPWGPVNEELARREPWYEKNHQRYRKLISDWVEMDDHDDDFEECMRVSNAVPNAWAAERKDKRKGPLSITHYMPARVLLYDLLGGKLQFDMGKVQSNGEARGKIKEKMTDPNCIQAVECMSAMAGVEQRMKLYLTPYLLLTDPETQCLYPVVNSLLNSRRMAASTPNPMQLSKRGESTYVRGFFLPDNDDHLIVSLDWSSIELVIIGELSKDPEFFKAYGQLPHQDLHTGATTSVLGVELPWLTDDHFHAMRRLRSWDDFFQTFGVDAKDCKRLMTNLVGEAIPDPGKARGFWRTEIGKGANFNYFFSGWLHTVGQRMGWSMQTTANAVDLYRDRFHVAEEWRVDTILQGQQNGWVQLPDGQRRFRYEAMQEFSDWFKIKWPDDKSLEPIVHEIARRISKRAQNQLVNSLVQGTCATIMKRSILRMREHLGKDARFMIPIHDEKVYSVHWELVPDFIAVANQVMCEHRDIFPTLKLDTSAAIGMTFEPWHPVKAPFGQIELNEPPAELGLGESRLNDEGIRAVVDYLRNSKMRMAA